jgi:hypothetical protein
LFLFRKEQCAVNEIFQCIRSIVGSATARGYRMATVPPIRLVKAKSALVEFELVGTTEIAARQFIAACRITARHHKCDIVSIVTATKEK